MNLAISHSNKFFRSGWTYLSPKPFISFSLSVMISLSPFVFYVGKDGWLPTISFSVGQDKSHRTVWLVRNWRKCPERKHKNSLLANKLEFSYKELVKTLIKCLLFLSAVVLIVFVSCNPEFLVTNSQYKQVCPLESTVESEHQDEQLGNSSYAYQVTLNLQYWVLHLLSQEEWLFSFCCRLPLSHI